MAQDQKKPPVGGNKPRPSTASGANAGQSAKDKSRAQSRPVTGKAPTGKGGVATGTARSGGGGNRGGGGNKPRPGGRPAPTPPKRTLSGAAMAWGAVGLVIVIIVVLVVVKATSSTNNSNASYTPVTPAPASVVSDVTNIPLSVYNTVGVSSPTVTVNPPIVLTGQKPLTLQGKSPATLYLGAEYCPYCAAERWALTAALSRFGTWSNLKITASSHTDVYPATHTFSYYGATFTSTYLTFSSIEQLSNIPDGNSYKPLQNPTKEEAAVINKFNDPKYITGATVGQVSYPFIDIGNVALISGASYSPGVLAGQTWSQIASGLSNPSNPATQAIVASANYITASICASTKNAPAAVCTSSGVEAAAKTLKLG